MGREPRRASGRPHSANGASSCHLWWDLPIDVALVEVSAVLEILEPPAVDSLYFWALQVEFADGRRRLGGGHAGLQWNRRYPGGTAVNWGGYASQEEGGFVLPGTESVLPGFADDPHTRAFSWSAPRPYRLRVYRPPDLGNAWRAEVGDLETGEVTVVRDLLLPGSAAVRSPDDASRLVSPVVWSEVFADCDAPPVIVRWSGFEAVDPKGTRLLPRAVRVNYQSHADGGCTNTTVAADDVGVLQITSTSRMVPQGASLLL